MPRLSQHLVTELHFVFTSASQDDSSGIFACIDDGGIVTTVLPRRNAPKRKGAPELSDLEGGAATARRASMVVFVKGDKLTILKDRDATLDSLAAA